MTACASWLSAFRHAPWSRGVLLQQIAGAEESTRYGQVGAVPPVTRTQAGAMLVYRSVSARSRFASLPIPEPEFNRQVEGAADPDHGQNSRICQAIRKIQGRLAPSKQDLNPDWVPWRPRGMRRQLTCDWSSA